MDSKLGMDRNYWIRVSILLGVAILLVIIIPKGHTGVILLPGRVGTFQEGPELGPNLGAVDIDTCQKLRLELIAVVEAMYVSFNEVRKFASSYDGDVTQLQAFQKDWRAEFIELKQELFTLATCDDFFSQWMLALATWRDIFRFEKETISFLSRPDTKGGSLQSETEVETRLLTLLEALKP